MNLRSFLSQSGFSLVQGMVLSGALAGTALVGVRLMEDQKKAVKTAEIKDVTESLHNLVVGILQDRTHCIATLLNNSLSPGTAISPNQTFEFNTGGLYTRIGGVSSAPTRVFRTKPAGTMSPDDVYMSGNVWISDMRLVLPANLQDTASFQITYERMASAGAGRAAKAGTGGKTVRKVIPMVIQRRALANTVAGGASTLSNVIEGCYAVSAASSDASAGMQNSNRDLNQDFCANLGHSGKANIFEWNDAANACVLRNNVCPWDQIFEGIDSVGVVKCRTVGQMLHRLIDNTATPCSGATAVRFEKYSPDGGVSWKVRIRCN